MRIILFLLLSISAIAQTPENHLTLHVLPPAGELNWNSPTSLLWSVQKNRLGFQSYPLGLVITELKCQAETNLYAPIYRHLDLFNQLVLEGRGLGVFHHTFPGLMEDEGRLRDELSRARTNKKVRFITFEISSEHCQRLQKYIKEFTELNVVKNWGFPHSPRRAEGANDASFAVSALSVLGFEEEIFREGWLRSVLLPLELVGPPLEDKRVNIWSLLGASWASPKSAHVLLHIWDKERMYQWLELNLKNFPTHEREGIKGIHLERRHFPVLKTPLWKEQENLQ